MSHPQSPPHPDTAYIVVQSPKPPASGLKIASGIISIVTSIWVLVLAVGLTFIALEENEYYPGRWTAIAAVVGGLFWITGLLLMVVGIVAIVKSRKPGTLLPLLLLCSGAVVIVGGVVHGVFGISGLFFAVMITLSMLPLVIVALLAFLAAKKTQHQT